MKLEEMTWISEEQRRAAEDLDEELREIEHRLKWSDKHWGPNITSQIRWDYENRKSIRDWLLRSFMHEMPIRVRVKRWLKAAVRVVTRTEEA